jgi:thioredoxin-dependent peroxiredoxin
MSHKGRRIGKKASKKPRRSGKIRKRARKPNPVGARKLSGAKGAEGNLGALKEGDLAPDFSLIAENGKAIALSVYRGRKVVLFFYPRDFTPGCTREVCSFRDRLAAIEQRGAKILGVSGDSVESHEKFSKTHSLSYPLLSDMNKEVMKGYGVWQQKSLYGRTFMGVVRSTFIINEDGVIQKVFRRVKVDGHVDEIIEML